MTAETPTLPKAGQTMMGVIISGDAVILLIGPDSRYQSPLPRFNGISPAIQKPRWICSFH